MSKQIGFDSFIPLQEENKRLRERVEELEREAKGVKVDQDFLNEEVIAEYEDRLKPLRELAEKIKLLTGKGGKFSETCPCDFCRPIRRLTAKARECLKLVAK